MGAPVHLDFGGQTSLRECLLQDVLLGRRPLIVVRGDGDEELRLGL